jgi:hypothetical protein
MRFDAIIRYDMIRYDKIIADDEMLEEEEMTEEQVSEYERTFERRERVIFDEICTEMQL